ncbi:hypothetical protein [Paenibacillus sp. MMS20-IR301]|uniref:hypothetical protein n=1 Tax=Paenibacillus sp. MMS20-IR301 TaxID=2895946 RepID=UPI0028EFA6C6|nr:hypothetical protein [Paenibacillus sp. MMS20-IR301]WNS42842.1 hypothetical protein LOS79_28380 [Paenibacillus sp. MMS20-IR301]
MNANEVKTSELEQCGREQNTFGKKQLAGSAVFSPKEKDVLAVVLQENEYYTVEEVKQLMELYLTKEVI